VIVRWAKADPDGGVTEQVGPEIAEEVAGAIVLDGGIDENIGEVVGGLGEVIDGTAVDVTPVELLGGFPIVTEKYWTRDVLSGGENGLDNDVISMLEL